MSAMLFKLMAAGANTPAAVDSTPNAFSFTAAPPNVVAGSTQTSNTITLGGMDAGASAGVTVTGGTYSKNSGGYTSAAGTGSVNDTFSVRHTASSAGSTAVNTSLNVGGVTSTFTSTTAAGTSDVTPNALNWGNIGTANSNANTNSQTVSGINTAITLRVDFDEDRDNYTLQANVNGTLVGNAVSSPGNFSFSVSNNDVVYFRAVGGETRDSTADVTNTSDGGAAIDSFNISMEE